MKKTLDTIVEDIYNLFVEGATVSDEVANRLGNAIATSLTKRLAEPFNPRVPSLSMSNIGQHPLELWYNIKGYEPEPMQPQVYLKFFLGDIVEEVVLALAEIAGHEVRGQQDTVELNGIKGHRDAVIDGVTVDVKSAAPYSFKKFKYGELGEEGNDAFGYIAQISGYAQAATDTDSKDGAFLAMDKVSGELALLYVHEYEQIDATERIEFMKEIMSRDTPPTEEEAPLSIQPDGKSGNMMLNVPCSYHRQKFNYMPNLRMFLYSGGPRYLTHVEVEPRVPELDIKTGEIIVKEEDAIQAAK